MNNIGFRVKLNDYINDKYKLEYFLDLYFSKYNIMEIKVNNSLINSANLDYLLSKLDNKDVSYHISKSFLKEPTENDRILIEALSGSERYCLITHIPDNIDSYRLDHINSNLPKNIKILCENPNYFESQIYIDYIIDFYKIIEKYDSIRGCLDLGHLFYNQLKTNNKNYLERLLKYIKFNCIDEYHIHDFDINGDHKQIGKGLLDIEYINHKIGHLLYDSRIILETNIDDEELEQGVKQIKRVLK